MIDNTICFTATLTFPEFAHHCTSVGPKPWDDKYKDDPPQTIFIELDGEREISLYAVDLEGAKESFERVVRHLGATSVKDIHPKVFPKVTES